MNLAHINRLVPNCLALIALVAPTAAISQSAGKKQLESSPQIFQSLQACRDVTDNVERLACYDRTIEPLSAAVESKQVIVIEEKELAQTKRSLFGFKLPDISLFGGGDKDEQDKELTSTVASARDAANGRWNITTAEGAIWQTTEPLLVPPQVGDALAIKGGAMGGYFMKVKNRRAVRARRLE